MNDIDYQEPEKRAARERGLAAAIRVLTTERSSSTVIRPDDVEQVLDFALHVLTDPAIKAEAQQEFRDWTAIHTTHVGLKKSSSLKVLYLCGPSPLNDLQVMVRHGVDPHNVWAVEANEEIAGRAVRQLARYNQVLKLHSGPLVEFLEALPEVFDVLYFDACGPILGRHPSSLAPLLAAAIHRRLAPQAAIVTTFTEIPEEQREQYTKVMTSYFRYRYNDFPAELFEAGLDPAVCQADDSGLETAIADRSGPCYSTFLTRFLIDIFRGLAPSTRAFASRAFSDAMMAKDRMDAMAKAKNLPPQARTVHEWFLEAGDLLRNPSSYPLSSFYEDLRKRLPQHALTSQLADLGPARAKFPEAICFTELLGSIIEGHWTLPSHRLGLALGAQWFDEASRFSCDVPLPNLVVSALLGVYGFPKFPIPEHALRLEYTAKVRKMYLDVLPIDECRSFFDWWPTVDLVPIRFRSKGFQVVARCLMDRMSWSDWNSDSHPFRGGAVACQGDVACATPRELPSRELLE
jgi:hypothetical protein